MAERPLPSQLSTTTIDDQPPTVLTGNRNHFPEADVVEAMTDEVVESIKARIGSLKGGPATVRAAETLPSSKEQAHDPVATRKKWLSDRLAAAALLVLILLCLLWLLWILVLTANPTMTVNTLMDTGDFDYGTFWLMSNPPPVIVGFGVGGLACVAVGYVATVVKIVGLLRRRPQEATSSRRNSTKVLDNLRAKVANSNSTIAARTDSRVASKSRSESAKRAASKIVLELLDDGSVTRQRIASAVKFAEIFVQCVVLAQFLEDGMPESLCVLFAVIVALNALTSAVFVVLPYENMGRVHVLSDTGFDLVVAVLFPIIEVLYAKYYFNFDRPLFGVNQAIFPVGFFERFAVIVSDPSRTELIRHVLDSLRIDSALKVFTRVGTSVSLCHRFMELAELVQSQLQGVRRHKNVYPTKNRFFVVAYFLLFVGIVVCTEESLRTSKEACAMHRECAQYAHRWIYDRAENDYTRCPCISIIDRDLEVANYEDWVSPSSRVAKVGQLANSGFLQTLQLVNRGLETIPEELRGCKNLKHMSLYYTNTRTLPDWFGELTSLEFLHIEGKDSGPTSQESLHSLPENLFDNMDKLLLIHIALHRMAKLPRFDGLVNVRSISLGIMMYMEEFPNFDKLRNVERLMIGNMPSLITFPQLDNLANLKMFIVVERGQFCCNGFLGSCNLTSPLCQYNLLWDKPAVTQCLPDSRAASQATRDTFTKFNGSTCGGVLLPIQLEMPPTHDAMLQCNGTMFRECVVPGYGQGMCYNPRWMPVSCNPSPFAIKMRQEQIKLQIGDPCDPVHEAWLGCA